MDSVFENIAAERQRQEDKWGGRENPNSILPRPNSAAAQHAKLSVLVEEVGEVANAILETPLSGAGHRALFDAQLHLREELVQVAAVAVAWLESFIEDWAVNT